MQQIFCDYSAVSREIHFTKVNLLNIVTIGVLISP